MNWRIYINDEEKIYKILGLEQKHDDLYIFPQNTEYLSRDYLKNLQVGEEFTIKESHLSGKVSHYSAHSTGEKHIKDLENKYVEVIQGETLRNLSSVIPLITMVSSTNKGSEVDKTKGKWFGFKLPINVNSMILEIVAFPLNANLSFRQSFIINNTRKTTETFDYKVLAMNTCNIGIIVRTSNYE